MWLTLACQSLGQALHPLSTSPAASAPTASAIERGSVVLGAGPALEIALLGQQCRVPGMTVPEKTPFGAQVFRTFWNFPEQGSSFLCSHLPPSLECPPAGLSSCSASVIVLLGRTGLLYTLMSHAFCTFQRFTPAEKILVVPSLSLLLTPHASLLGLFLRLLKKIELFGSRSTMVGKRARLGLGGGVLTIRWLGGMFKRSLLFGSDNLSIWNVLGVL